MTEHEREIVKRVKEELEEMQRTCRAYADRSGLPGDLSESLERRLSAAAGLLDGLVRPGAGAAMNDLERVACNLAHGSLFTRKPEDND